MIKMNSEAADFLVDNYKWDDLTAASVWAFGPNHIGPNMLINYTIGTETDSELLNASRDAIV